MANGDSRTSPRNSTLYAVTLAACLASRLLFPALLPAASQPKAVADVVVVVDTSVSMARPGMDPQRSSLLVAKLFADIVPGNLGVVRVLDLTADKALVPSRNTGVKVSCDESATGICEKVEALSDWWKDARAGKFGALIRPSRGDEAFKEQLDAHLTQNRHNSQFGISFRSAQGILDARAGDGIGKTIIWLSDGETDDPKEMVEAIHDLTSQGVDIRTIIFGNANPENPRKLGLSPSQVHNPAELMKAFAAAFRQIVQAPYELDHLVSTDPDFEVKPKVDEMWVVVYGDDTLGDVTLDSPHGSRPANYAHDRQAGAGAYRVLYEENPPAGRWSVHVTGGGPRTAFAVIQRSALMPFLISPAAAIAGVPIAVEAGIGYDPAAPPVTASNLPPGTTMEFTWNGRTYKMSDDGSNGDKVAGDGKFTTMVTFDTPGVASVLLAAKGEILNRSVKAQIPVSGVFKYHGGPQSLDLGSFRAGDTKSGCATFSLTPAEQTGAIPFELISQRSLPSGHTFELRTPAAKLLPGKALIAVSPAEPLTLCLVTDKRAPSSHADGERWLTLRVAGSSAAESSVPLNLRWRVKGLSWWELWGWLIEIIAGILLGIFILMGWIVPRRFPRGFAIIYVPDRGEIDEQSPRPLTESKGTGIGWYRDARAYLHPNFRVSGDRRGAVASLHAKAGSAMVKQEAASLFRETSEGDFEPVPEQGRSAGSDVYRVSDGAGYFRLFRRG